MTVKEIVTKAIKKAIANGWYGAMHETFEVRYLDRDYFDSTEVLAIVWLEPNGEHKFDRVTLFSELIVFEHDFARTLWSEGKDYASGKLGSMPLWRWHLANMILADDPIKYLEASI